MKHKKGQLTDDAYNTFLKDQVKSSVEFQEEIGIDVLVHGEFERNDMVEYFGEQLKFTFTQYGYPKLRIALVKLPIIWRRISIKPNDSELVILCTRVKPYQ